MSGKDALTIGLTGGIASGKSEVANRFADLGVPIIDSDEIARELVATGSQALLAIVAAFGPEAIDEYGQLRRAWLRQRIFEDPNARQTLDGILHPLIWEQIIERRSQISVSYCVVVVPLLFETGLERYFDRILVVDAPAETRIKRLIERDGVSESDARAAFSAQLSGEERRAGANDIVDNNGDLSELDRQVGALHEKYLLLAG